MPASSSICCLFGCKVQWRIMSFAVWELHPHSHAGDVTCTRCRCRNCANPISRCVSELPMNSPALLDLLVNLAFYSFITPQLELPRVALVGLLMSPFWSAICRQTTFDQPLFLAPESFYSFNNSVYTSLSSIQRGGQLAGSVIYNINRERLTRHPIWISRHTFLANGTLLLANGTPPLEH